MIIFNETAQQMSANVSDCTTEVCALHKAVSCAYKTTIIFKTKKEEIMKLINTFQCEFCNKIYKSEVLCRNHEDTCNLNPKRKNCDHCFLRSKSSIELKYNGHFEFRVCLLNHDIIAGRKSNCPDFVSKNERHCNKIKDYSVKEVYSQQNVSMNAVRHYNMFMRGIS